MRSSATTGAALKISNFSYPVERLVHAFFPLKSASMHFSCLL